MCLLRNYHLLIAQPIVLLEAYIFLRNLEHRLQYIDDAQTHQLPQDETDRALVASMCGFEDWTACAAKIAAVRATVAGKLGET